MSKIKPIKMIQDPDPRPIRAADVFFLPYLNGAIVGPTQAGKTWLLNTLIDISVGPNTHIVIFSSTVDTDVAIMSIIKNYRDDGYEVSTYPCILDKRKGVNYLENFVEWKEGEDAKIGKSKPGAVDKQEIFIIDSQKETKSGKPALVDKFKPVDWVFIFDDCGKQLRLPIVGDFVKKCRHYKARTFFSMQAVTDLAPESWDQIKMVMLLKGITAAKLEKMYNALSILDVDFDTFYHMYRKATEKKYGFLFYSNNSYRVGFDEPLNIEDYKSSHTNI